MSTPPPYPVDFVLYRSFSREPSPSGRATDKDFMLRANEATLSVALTPEKAMYDLDSRGYVELFAARIRAMGLNVTLKTGDDNPTDDHDLYEIVGIPRDSINTQRSIALALAETAGITVSVPGRRKKSNRRTPPVTEANLD